MASTSACAAADADNKTPVADESIATLSNGVSFPRLGFGCAFGNWSDPSRFIGFQPDLGWAMIPAAIRAGYKHFDCALVYGSHRVVGTSLGINAFAKGVKRSDIHVTTKVYHFPADDLALGTQSKAFDMSKPEIDIRARVVHDVEKSLDELSMGYVDLCLLHWPGNPAAPDADTLQSRLARKQAYSALEAVLKTGRARAIGVSNFAKKHLEQLLEDCSVKPMVNQIEKSPYRAQHELTKFCQDNGIFVQGWAPFGSGGTGVLADPTINALAKTHGKNAGQIILRWLVQHGCGALPKSSNEKRMAGNLDVYDFKLTADDMGKLDKLDAGLAKSSVPVDIEKIP